MLTAMCFANILASVTLADPEIGAIRVAHTDIDDEQERLRVKDLDEY